MSDGQIQMDNIKEIMDKRFDKDSDSTSTTEDMDQIKKCVEEGKQRLNWIGKNVLNI